MSTTHEEREAFALLDEAIDALFAIARDTNSDPNDVPVDAVLIVGVQTVEDNGDRIGTSRSTRAPAANRPTSRADW